MRARARGVVAAATALVLLTACGDDGDDDAVADDASVTPTSAPSSAPSSTPSEDSDEGPEDPATEPAGSSPPAEAGTALAVIDGIAYGFSAGEGPGSQCVERFGGLLVSLPLTQIDGAATSEQGQLSLTLAEPAEENSVTLNLMESRFLAGYNEINLDTPALTLVRDAASAQGTQQLVSPGGKELVADITVTC